MQASWTDYWKMKASCKARRSKHRLYKQINITTEGKYIWTCSNAFLRIPPKMQANCRAWKIAHRVDAKHGKNNKSINLDLRWRHARELPSKKKQAQETNHLCCTSAFRSRAKRRQQAGYAWKLMDIHWYPWTSKDIFGRQWMSMYIHAFPSTYMDSCAAKNCTFSKCDLRHCAKMLILSFYPPCAAKNCTFKKYDLQHCGEMISVIVYPPCAADNSTFRKCDLQRCAKMPTMHMRKRSVPKLALH